MASHWWRPSDEPEGLIPCAVHGLGVRVEVGLLNESSAALVAGERPETISEEISHLELFTYDPPVLCFRQDSPVFLAVDLAVRHAPVAAGLQLAELFAHQPLPVVNGALVQLHVGLAQRTELALVAFELLKPVH